MSGWVSHFGLKHDPFSDDPRLWSYYYGGNYGVASLRLESALLTQLGHVVVTGPAGTGKSALVRSVLKRSDAFATAVVSAAQRPPAAVLDALIQSREPQGGAFSATRKRAALLTMIEDAKRLTKPILCVIEDAHVARAAQLKDLLASVNISPDAHEVLRLVLVGRTPLERTIDSRSLSALRSRVTARIVTGALAPEEVIDYLTDRLEGAGAANPEEVLAPTAMRAIAEKSGGVVALCDTIARRALERGAETNSQVVTNELVEQVASIYSPLQHPRRLVQTMRTVPSVIISASIIGLVALALIVAAAQIQMVGSEPMAVRSTHAGSESAAEAAPEPAVGALAQGTKRPSMREKFLDGTSYEVEIKPPQRPSLDASSSRPSMQAPVQGRPPVAGRAEPPDAEMNAVAPLRPPTPTGSPHIKRMPEPMGTAKATAPPARDPLRPVSLQVGAFRELRSAAELKARLQQSFPDVHVSTKESGGEPLYRVRVGHFATANDTELLKAKLQANGFPSFRVTD